VYDVAVQRFPRKVQLREHFRCLTPIIEFSNARYYDGRLVPLRDRMPTPDWKPLNSVFVRDGFRDGQDCNRPEAERIAELIGQLVDRPEYASRTFGVITLLGNNQSKLVQDLVFDALGPLKMEAHAVRVGEAALFQGDERDVVFVSTVVADNGGKSIGAMTAKPYQQMVNVAASRARDQLWVVHSIPADAFPAGDERAALIRHCSAALSSDESYAALVDKTDQQSPFERALLRRMLERGYRTIRPQHQVGRYKIDFVVDGPSSRLAIECDGDRFHGPDQWDADRARQEVLERAGWTFIRIRGSAFYRDPARALEPLWAKLDELAIPPYDWTVRSAEAEATPVVQVAFAPPTGQRVRLGADAPFDGDRQVELGPAVTAGTAERSDATAVTDAPANDEEPMSTTVEPEADVSDAPVAPISPEDPWASAFRVAEQRIQGDRASGARE
jgi:very-short-patch-repair endonuclease